MENESRGFARPAIDSAAIAADVRTTPMLLLTAVSWCYIGSNYLYRIWYAATAMAMAAIAILVAARVLRVNGLGAAIAPVIAYFAVLAGSAAWARYPSETMRWVAIDSIGILIFALAFLAGRNAPPPVVARAMTTLIIPALAMTILMALIDPSAPRIAQYAVAILPFAAPFVWLRIVETTPRWPAVLTLTLMFAVLIVGRSRTHFATAVLSTCIAALTLRKNRRGALREAAALALIVAVAVCALWIVPWTRTPLATMFVRLTHADLNVGGLHVEAEPVNAQRVALDEVSRSLLASSMPLGIGYGNFLPQFRSVTGYGLQIHSAYTHWLLEGGVACVAVVIVLVWRHVRALAAWIRSAATEEERRYGQVVAISSAGILTIGVFHQVHQTPAFWMMLGFGAACGAEAWAKGREGTPDTVPLLERWKRAEITFAPALCEPLMQTALAHLARCPPGGWIADIGCGTGFMLPVFRAGGHRAMGLDVDRATLRERNTVAASGEQVPLRSDSLDGLFVFSAFQYMDRDGALEECRRVLRPGGRIAVIENLEGNPIARLSRALRRLRGLGYPPHLAPREHLRWAARSVYERHFSEVAYELHHVFSPLFLYSRALDVPAAPLRRTRLVLAALRVVQQLERRALAAGWFRGGAWHVVITARK